MSSLDESCQCLQDANVSQSSMDEKSEPEESIHKLDFGENVPPEEDKLALVAEVHSSGAVFACLQKTLVRQDGDASPMQLVLGSEVECLAISDDGRHAVVGLRSGEITIVHFKIEAKIVFSRKLPGDFSQSDGTPVMVEIVLWHRRKDIYDILIILSSGRVMRLRGVDLRCSDAPQNLDDSLPVEILRECLSGEKVNTACTAKVFGNTTIFLGGNVVISLNEDGKSTVGDLQKTKCSLQKLSALEGTNLLIGLTEDHSMVAIDIYTLMALKLWHKYTVSDFRLLYGEAQQRAVLLTAPEQYSTEDFLKCHLIMVTLPDFQEHFKTEVNPVTFLVGGKTNEMIYFEFCELGFLKKKIQFWKGPLSHEERLKQLLEQGRLEEAEELARTEGLDARPVLKARAFRLVEDLVPWEGAERQRRVFDDVLALLGHFEFVGFLRRFCDVTIVGDYDRTRSLFHYAQKKLDLVNAEDEGKISREHAALLSTVSNILLRLNTYKMLYPEQSQDSSWQVFHLCDLYKECLRFLSEGQLNQAGLIWLRHNSSFCMSFSEEKVQELVSVPRGVCLDDYLRWLKCMLPALLNRQPHWYKLVVASAVARIRSAESEDSSWPAAALSFARQLRDFLHSDKRLVADVSSVIVLDYQQYDEASLVKQFYDLIFTLEQLEHLQQKNHIHISLAEFLQTDKEEVVYALLNQVPPSDIAAFLDGFLAGYMLDQGLQHDQVLLDYVTNIAADANWWDCSVVSSGWEEAAAALVRCIYDSAVKEQCIVAVLKSAQVPWSETVSDLVKLGIQLKQALASEIRQQLQLVDAKLVMKKYGLRDISQINRRVIQYILRQGHEDCLQDALQFASSSQRLTEEVYVIFTQEYISSGQEDRALELLGSLSPALAARACRQSVFRVMARLEQEAPDDRACDRHVSGLRLARARLPEADLCCAAELENMCHIARQRGVTLNEKMYSTAKVRTQLLESFVGKFVEAGDYAHGKIRQLVDRLARFFVTKREEVLLLLGIQNLELQKGADLTEKVIALLSLGCETWEDIPVRLHSFLCRVLCSENTLTPAIAAHIEEMVCSLCATCGKSELHDWVSLYSWAWMLNQSLSNSAANTQNTRDHYVRWRLTPLYYDSHPEAAGTAGVLSEFFLLIVYYSRKKVWHRTDSAFYLNFSNNNDSKWLKATKHRRKELLSRMDSVCEVLCQHGDLLSLQAAATLAGSLSMLQASLEKYSSGVEAHRVRAKLRDAVDGCLPALLLKTIGAIRIDQALALGVLCSFVSGDRAQLFREYLNRFSSDSYRSKLLAQLGLQFSMITDESAGRAWYKDLLKRLKWSEKLISLGVPCGDLFRGDGSFVDVILDGLTSARGVNLSMIIEYCYDFDVGLLTSLTKYLEKVIGSWEPQMVVTTNFEGRREMVVKNDEEEVFAKCKEVVDLLKAEYEKRISVFLIELMSNINFYHYEMYMCVFKLLRSLNTSHQFRISSIVLYLKTYQRNMPPQQEEREQWLLRFPDSNGLPPIAEYRLPLEVFIQQDKWKVLKLLGSEINLATYNQWLMACGTLPLDRDRILGIAIKESVTVIQSDKSAPDEEWCVYKRNSTLLKQIEQCAEQFGDLEVASASLYYLAHHMPPGVDQCTAAELCRKYTERWALSKGTQQASQLVVKMRHKHLRCATSNILHGLGLGQSGYVVFSPDPRQLLHVLYQHLSVVDRSRGTAPDRPDINKAAKMLAALHEFDLFEFWSEEVKEWMMPYQHTTQKDEVTMDLTVLLCKQEPVPNFEENLARVCYILQLNSKEESSNFLFSLAFKDLAGLSDYTLRLRALKCLMGFAEPKFLEEVTYMTVENIRKYMKSLYYVSKLQKFGLVYSVESFEITAKKSIVLDLMQAHDRNPDALILVSRMCIEFSMFSAEVWVHLLQQMAKFKLVDELEHTLLGISGTQYHILRSASVVNAWNTVLLEPFLAADGPAPGGEGEGERACLHSLGLLQSCSVVDLVDQAALAGHCLRLGRPDWAALLLPYAEEARRAALLQEILSASEPSEIRLSLQKLAENGLLIAVQAADMLPA
ncbi:kinetochore-associated protein 1 [Bacillus rossius redtenbacheri]|uniref:kinetochore-associated protein 1 n=1 Tax=Bacillus rossius redtenbacheri TaxID=93214 RepID=UPI002FDEACE9